MNLTVINSNSQGNCYLLTDSDGYTLILEAGCNIHLVKQALKFDFSKVLGVLVTHHHKDHCKAVPYFLQMGVRVYGTSGELKKMDIPDRLQNFCMVMEKEQLFTLGKFRIKFFGVNHGTPLFPCPDPVGFFIDHPESGTFPFITDTYYCDYKFSGMHNIIVEANYCTEILESRAKNPDELKMFLRDRIIQSHLSIDSCSSWLKMNDLSKVNNILLIHLSDSNSDSRKFKQKIEGATGKVVHIARPGLAINWDRTPF